MLFFPVVVFPGWRLGVSVFGSLLPGWGLGVSALHLFPKLEARSIDFSFFSQAGCSEYQLSIFPGLEARSINFQFVSLAGGLEYQLCIRTTGWRLGVTTFRLFTGWRLRVSIFGSPDPWRKQNRSSMGACLLIPNWRIETGNPGHRGNTKLLYAPPGEPSLTHTLGDGRKGNLRVKTMWNNIVLISRDIDFLIC